MRLAYQSGRSYVVRVAPIIFFEQVSRTSPPVGIARVQPRGPKRSGDLEIAFLLASVCNEDHKRRGMVHRAESNI